MQVPQVPPNRRRLPLWGILPNPKHKEHSEPQLATRQLPLAV